MLKLKNPKTTSPSNADLAPLPERRRSTFREPAAEVDLGLFGLPKGEPEAVDVLEMTDVVEAPEIPVASEATEPVETPETVGVPDSTETPVATPADAPDAPVASPQQQRARHRADRAGNRRATGSSFRVALPAH